MAITEYKRYVFFGAPGSDRDHAAGRIGLAYEHLEQYEAAERAFRRAAELASTDSTRESRRFDAARIAIRRGEIARAELELARLKLFATQSTSRHRAALQLARIELRGRRWDEMQASLDSIPGFFTTADGSRLGALLSVARTERLRSTAGARRLSTWLPGSGQIYSGAILHGLHSQALNGVLVWQLADAVRRLSVGNAVIASSFLHRYYRGGQYHAARLAEERNARRLGPLLEDMEELLNGMDRE